MVHAWTPGNALGCNVNSHRHGWGGQICDHPGSWNCGATHDFRTGYCERGDGRCYHLNLFQEEDPSLVIDDHGVGWLLEPDVHALDDQLLLLWGNQFAEPRGIRESGAQRAIVFGAYRIQRVEPQTSHYRTTWRIVPHPGSWTRLNLLQVERPRYQSLGGPYIKQIDGSAVQRLFRRLEEAAQGAHDAWLSAEDRARFNSFHGGLEGWLEQARVRAESGDGGSPLFHARPSPAASARGGAPGMGYKPFKGLKAEPAPPPRGGQSAAASSAASAEATLPGAAPSKLADGELESVESPSSEPSFAGSPRAASAPTEVELHAPRVPHLAVEAQAPLPEEAARSELAQLYGESTLTALQVGSLTKPLLVLAGSPGVGKSTLAHRLIDDPEERRTLTVPVASTWRGREDLIGHVNPINNEFEPTPFTCFLNTAANAWEQGDRRTRIVVFEEFNLAQPEFWLSEVLVRSQFPASSVLERTIQLGGARVRGWAGASHGVYLAPSVRFVATVNSDHTTRLLSPRVLDRAAVVAISIEPRDAIAAVGVGLTDDQLDAIADLDFLTRPKDATFSIRTARSLRACLERRASLGLDDPWRIIDIVLTQEVLSKVRLLAGDPEDRRLCEALVSWSEPQGKHLPACASMISLWLETLHEGRDVAQV